MHLSQCFHPYVINLACSCCNWFGCMLIGIVSPFPPCVGTVTLPINTLSVVFSCNTCSESTRIICNIYIANKYFHENIAETWYMYTNSRGLVASWFNSKKSLISLAVHQVSVTNVYSFLAMPNFFSGLSICGCKSKRQNSWNYNTAKSLNYIMLYIAMPLIPL